MNTITGSADPEQSRDTAIAVFSQVVGVPHVDATTELVGNQEFLKFKVGRRSPIYEYALRQTLKSLPEGDPYQGLLGLQVESPESFPGSMEADVLLGLLARSTRSVSQSASRFLEGQYVPFQNNEETQAIQPATHLIVGRRGVGKSTLILKAQSLLDRTASIPVVLDMQPYAHRNDQDVLVDVLSDLSRTCAQAVRHKYPDCLAISKKLDEFSTQVLDGTIRPERSSAAFRRIVAELTTAANADLFVFLDDYHLLNSEQQPRIAETIHGALKGARGWLKLAGLRSLLRVYDPKAKMGLQSPGDAQVISLDLTLVDPEAAEDHLRRILSNFLALVGIENMNEAIAQKAFHRLVWANAGVPRDFLQMYARSLEQAARASRRRVELSDANLAIGEFGQQKMADLEQDARNEESEIKKALTAIEEKCLEEEKTNAFLIRNESTPEYRAVQTLSDLRLLHLLHQTITPHKAGERYEAYMLDYSLFTGFRRRPSIKQMLPADGKQFKASELRKLPILPRRFLKR
jgi:hypothetical protein